MAAIGQDYTSRTSGSVPTSAEDVRKHTKLPGFATMEGQDYEVKMAALLYARALNSKGEFQLATNVAGAGALDDIVFKFTTPDQVCQTAFIQLKHKKSARVYLDSLVKSRGDFSLAKYFDAYVGIKRSFLETVGGNVLYNGDFESCSFLIFTNAILHKGKGGVETLDLPSPVDEHIKLNEVEASFTDDLVEKLYFDLKKEEEKQKKQSEHPFSSNVDDAKDFLRRLKLFTGQPSEDQLDDVIKEELKKFGIEKKDLDAVCRLFLERMKSWWQQSAGVILNQKSTILLEAHAEVMLQTRVKQLTEQQVKSFGLNIKFTESSTAYMKDACADQLYLVHVPSQQLFRMTASKVLQTLEPQRGKYIFLSLECLLKEREAVMSSWRHGKNDLLVLVCNETTNQEKEIVAELSQVLEEKEVKKLILISDSSDSFASQLREKMSPNVNIFQDFFHISQLAQESMNSIFKKEVVLQGTPTTLGAVIGEDLDRISNELKDVLETIIASESLVIGDKLKEGISYYMPRTLQYKKEVKKEIFSDEKYAGRIIIHGASLSDVDCLNHTHEQGFRTKFQQNSEGVVFNANNGKEIGKRDDKTYNNVHYLQLVGGRLLWKKTEGDINLIKKYIDTDLETIENVEDRVVLLIAEPGMGKTTQLVHEAQQTKLQHHNWWVVHVALSEHVTVLSHTKREYLNSEAFLHSAMSIGKMSAVAQALFKFCLNHTGNMMVLLDGCDEIAPRYTDQCLALVQSLLKTEVKKVWIASRRSMKNNLETHLSILAIGLREFNTVDQRGFLVKYWKENGDVTLSVQELDYFIYQVVTMTAQSICDQENTLLGIPLQTRMLGEVFQEHVSGHKMILPTKLNALELIEKFVEKKCRSYCVKSLKLDDTNPDFERLLDEQLMLFYEKHSTAALTFLLGDAEVQLLHSFDIDKSQKFISSVAEGTEKTGIIDIILDGKPAFVHRVFAEFFAAHWLSEHFHRNAEFMSKHLLSETFGVVRQMFDRILARDNEFHHAVLNTDISRVEYLMTVVDVISTDKGGRTALHLSVLAGLNNTAEDKQNIQIIQLLMTHNARVDVKDKVLKWTPVQYADALKLWAEMDTILKHSCIDMSQFITTKQSIDDEDTWESVVRDDYANVMSLLLDISHTKTYKSSSLLEKINSRLSNFTSSDLDRAKALILKAAEYGSAEVARQLIDRALGVTFRQTNRNYGNTLSDAHGSSRKKSYFGRKSLKKLLSARSAKKGRNALMISSCYYTISVVKIILESFSNQSELAEYINESDDDGNTALVIASSRGHQDIVDLFIADGADVTASHMLGWTGLMAATYSGHVSVVKSLLAACHDAREKAEYINARNDWGTSALWIACSRRSHDIVEQLIAGGADITERYMFGWTGLMAAAYSGHVLVVTSLLAAWRDERKKAEYVNARNDGGTSALWMASSGGYPDIVELLISGEADVTARGNDEWTGLMAATKAGHVSVVRSLLGSFNDARKKADYVNACDRQGRSALFIASSDGRHDILELLLAGGSDVTARDIDERTGLMMASEAGHMSVVTSLLATFNDERMKAEYVNARDKEGRSAMWLASRKGRHYLVELLSLQIDTAKTEVPHCSESE